MKKNIPFLLLFALVLMSGLHAQSFHFRYQPGVRYQMQTRIAEDVYLDGEYSHTSRMVMHEWLNVISRDKQFFTVAGDYMIAEDTSSLGVAYQQKREYKDNFYKLSPLGKFRSDKSNFMPVKRNFPLFKENIKRGDKWFSPSYEIHDFRGELFGIEYPYEVPTAVSWQYVGVKEVDGKRLNLLKARTSILHEPKPVPALHRRYPVAISGYNEAELYWNDELGLIHSIRESFDIRFDLSDGQVIRYKGESESRFEQMEPIPADELEALRKRLGPLGNEGRVDWADGWVRITLNNINFGPEDYELAEKEIAKLELIAREVAAHRGRVIRVVGHTALAGSEGGRKALSLKRAEVVRDFLVEKQAVEPFMVSIDGKGAGERLEKSGTKEGRKKNRRVEIYIMVGNQ